jgi:hypothetical protein
MTHQPVTEHGIHCASYFQGTGWVRASFKGSFLRHGR